jgi:predicted nucleotidyltransferase
MIRERVVASLRELAISLGQCANETEWHLFGSVERDEPNAADIDLMILCKTDYQADVLRQSIDPDAFILPIHLALLTFEEAAEVGAIQMQESQAIFP